MLLDSLLDSGEVFTYTFVIKPLTIGRVIEYEMPDSGRRTGNPYVAAVQKKLSETIYPDTEKPLPIPGDRLQESPVLR